MSAAPLAAFAAGISSSVAGRSRPTGSRGVGGAVAAASVAAVVIAAASLPTPAAASLDDPFWFAPVASDAPLRLSFDAEGVADTVDHAPNRPQGGFESVERLPRYVGGGIAVDWRPSSAWALRAAVTRRAVASMRDRYAVTGIMFGVARALPSPHRSTRLALVLDARANRAPELYKNSWTSLGDATLTEARLLDARDDGVELAVAGRVALDTRLGLSARLGAGLTKTGHERLLGRGDDGDGCRYDFDAADGRATLELVEPCDGLVAFREEYANEGGIDRRLGLAPSADLSYTARTLRTGLGADVRLGRVDAALAWSYARHDRANLDARIRARGDRTLISSHVTSFRLGVGVTRRLRLATAVHYRSTSYLDELPLLYGSFTAERFRRNTLSFGAGFTFAF